MFPLTHRLPVTLSFLARQEKDYSFKLKCKIKRKPSPLVLQVKAEGYKVNVDLSYFRPDGTELKLPTGRSDQRVIDFGQVLVKDQALGQISVFNQGLYGLEYKWVISHQSKHAGVVTVLPETGRVEANSKEVSQLQFSPATKMTLRNCQLILEVGLKFVIFAGVCIEFT